MTQECTIRCENCGVEFTFYRKVINHVKYRAFCDDCGRARRGNYLTSKPTYHFWSLDGAYCDLSAQSCYDCPAFKITGISAQDGCHQPTANETLKRRNVPMPQEIEADARALLGHRLIC